MEIQTLSVWSIAAFIFSAAMYVFYIFAIIRGETTNTSTWISWLLMDTVALAAVYQRHEIPYQLIAYALGCVAVLIAARIVRADAKWDMFDLGCVGLVAIAALAWLSTKDPATALIISLAAMCVGSIPLFLHLWNSNTSINPWPWLCNLAGAMCAIPAVVHWNPVDAAAPVIFLVLSVLFNAAMVRSHRNSKFWSSVLLNN